MKTLKVEGVSSIAFETYQDVADHLPRFIEKYNTGRLPASGLKRPLITQLFSTTLGALCP